MGVSWTEIVGAGEALRAEKFGERATMPMVETPMMRRAARTARTHPGDEVMGR
jgi:hypothetical protein